MTIMKNYTVASGLVACLALAQAALAADFEQNIEKTFQLAPGGKLTLDTLTNLLTGGGAAGEPELLFQHKDDPAGIPINVPFDLQSRMLPDSLSASLPK